MESELRYRVFQASSATLMPVGPITPWRNVKLLAGQRVVDTFEVRLPQVKAPTRFEVQWVDAGARRLGVTDLIACPTNLLATLKTMTGDNPIGVQEPDEEWSAALAGAGLEVKALDADDDLKAFKGRLLLVRSAKEPPEGLAGIKATLTAGDPESATIWVLPGPVKPRRERPILMSAGDQRRRIVAVPADALPDLARSAETQLRLVELVRMALASDPLDAVTQPTP